MRFSWRVAGICLGILFFLSFIPYFFLEDSAVKCEQFNYEEICLRRNKWGSFDERLAEQRRIMESVREEQISVMNMLSEVNNQYDEMQRLVPLKKEEITQLELKIDELKLVVREMKDRRNVRLFLPHQPLSLPNNGDVELESPRAFSSLEESFDFSRCSISSRFPVYLYPKAKFSTEYRRFLFEDIKNSPYIVTDPHSACLFIAFIDSTDNPHTLKYWNSNGRNHLLIFSSKKVKSNEFSAAAIVAESIEGYRLGMDVEVMLDVNKEDLDDWERLPQLLPFDSKFLFSFEIPSAFVADVLRADLLRLRDSATNSMDSTHIEMNCASKAAEARDSALCGNQLSRKAILQKSTFALIFDSQPSIQRRLHEALEAGAVPVMLSNRRSVLPFDEWIQWEKAVVRLPAARLTELHFILRSFGTADILEMKRRGRFLYENYLMNTKVLCRSLLAYFRFGLRIPGREEATYRAEGAFADGTFVPKEESVVTTKPSPFDDEYLGPVEMPIDSPAYNLNMTAMGLYADTLWNQMPNSIGSSPEFLPIISAHPSGAEFDEHSNMGMRPIAPGAGAEFAVALGGNRPREQFTAVILTHNRDGVLRDALERLHRCPYLNSVVVVWNNPGREPTGPWPRLHVPIRFVRAEKNSLNNRFLPFDAIRTEAVLSLDDDIDLKQHEIVFAFRVWRENRERLVGFPARHHAKYGDSDELYYNSNHTCQLSMILTGAAFIHKTYFHAYSSQMPAIIRQKIDDWMNCEDLAMNFFVAHLTRKPPIKTTSKWTLRCPTCSETLSQGDDHFLKRHNCIRFFVKVFGYNPLLFTQYRADSVLFKTRVPVNQQKCFRYV